MKRYRILLPLGTSLPSLPSLGTAMALAITAAFFLAAATCNADDRWIISGRTMGPVPYSVVIADPPDTVAEGQAKTAIADALERVNQQMSTYVHDSDVSRFNASASTDWFPVDPETVAVVKRSLDLTNLTDGAFDIRVAPAVSRWNFGPDKAEFELPSQAETDALAQSLVTSELNARLDPPALRKSNRTLQVDLSAIAKGYAADAVAKRLTDLKCENFMVEIGGEVVTRGHREAKRPWRLGIEKPTKTARSIAAKVPLSDRAMATSGDYRNFFTHAGQRYSHTIDPKTCRPVKHYLASVTVIANDCMTADALATALSVMGADKAHAFADQQGIEIYTIDRDGGFEGPLVSRSSDNFPIIATSQHPPVSSTDSANEGAAESIWPTFLAALLVFAIAITGMAVGAIFANKPVTGSCGGLSAMTGDDDEDASCSVCAKPVTDCVEK